MYFECSTGFFLKFMHSVAQSYSDMEQKSKSRICMHLELGKSIPVRQIKKKLENKGILASY